MSRYVQKSRLNARQAKKLVERNRELELALRKTRVALDDAFEGTRVANGRMIAALRSMARL